MFFFKRVFHSEDIKLDPTQGLTATTRNGVTRKGEQKDEEDIRKMFKKGPTAKGVY